MYGILSSMLLLLISLTISTLRHRVFSDCVSPRVIFFNPERVGRGIIISRGVIREIQAEHE